MIVAGKYEDAERILINYATKITAKKTEVMVEEYTVNKTGETICNVRLYGHREMPTRRET